MLVTRELDEQPDLDDFRDTFPDKLADRHRRIINRVWFFITCESCKGELNDGVCPSCDPEYEAPSWPDADENNPVLNWT